MLPGGMMPVTQLIAMARGMPPRGALGLLKALPLDRLQVVLADMRVADVARLLPVARPAERDRIITALPTELLVELVRTAPADQTHTLVSTLPDDRLRSIVDSLPARALAALPADRQQALFTIMQPEQAWNVMSVTYQGHVAHALVRANAEVTVPPAAPWGILLVRVLGWWVTVAARQGDDGRVGVRDAENAALRMGANAALSVTTNEPAHDVVHYCAEARGQGRSVTATMWTDDGHDTNLKRALVSLLQS